MIIILLIILKLKNSLHVVIKHFFFKGSAPMTGQFEVNSMTPSVVLEPLQSGLKDHLGGLRNNTGRIATTHENNNSCESRPKHLIHI